ncbi:MAG: hypothetical protein HY270_10310 [Deltaproteobacteria bacterium]|nr:hypothetical protein [Deltaproteobacteria bacterium]
MTNAIVTAVSITLLLQVALAQADAPAPVEQPVEADGAVVVAPAPQAEAAAITATDLRGGGGWVPNEVAKRPTQRWSLDVKRGDDNSLTGRIMVIDSPLLSSGKVNGKVDGKLVSGTITDDAGNYAASFDGHIDKQGFSGTYRDVQGGTGDWAWEGQLPQ